MMSMPRFLAAQNDLRISRVVKPIDRPLRQLVLVRGRDKGRIGKGGS